MPFSPLLVLKVGRSTKFQLFSLFNTVGPFLGLIENLGMRQHMRCRLLSTQSMSRSLSYRPSCFRSSNKRFSCRTCSKGSLHVWRWNHPATWRQWKQLSACLGHSDHHIENQGSFIWDSYCHVKPGDQQDVVNHITKYMLELLTRL